MGNADLWITKLRPQPGSHFEDYYNDAGLFSMMAGNTGTDLSWWQIGGRKELFNRSGNMTPEGAKVWRAELAPVISTFLSLTVMYWPDYDLHAHCHVLTENRLTEDECGFYQEWAKALLYFLDVAISMDSTIIWSV